MTDGNDKKGVIRRGAVRLARQPAMVDCGTTEQGHTIAPITVVPLLDGDRIAGFEVRCGCGAAAVVECVYDKENGT